MNRMETYTAPNSTAAALVQSFDFCLSNEFVVLNKLCCAIIVYDFFLPTIKMSCG